MQNDIAVLGSSGTEVTIPPCLCVQCIALVNKEALSSSSITMLRMQRQGDIIAFERKVALYSWAAEARRRRCLLAFEHDASRSSTGRPRFHPRERRIECEGDASSPSKLWRRCTRMRRHGGDDASSPSRTMRGTRWRGGLVFNSIGSGPILSDPIRTDVGSDQSGSNINAIRSDRIGSDINDA